MSYYKKEPEVVPQKSRNWKAYFDAGKPVFWYSMAATGAVVLGVLLLADPLAKTVPEFEAANQNTICDGLYCGGPFFQSPLGLMVMLAVPIALIGLILAVAKARGNKEAAK